MNRIKHKRLYYVPGLVSLILAPLLFAYFGNKEIQKLDVRVMEINMWVPGYENDSLLGRIFTIPERNYKKISLTRDKSDVNKTLNEARTDIKKLYASKDTVNGILLSFNPTAKYQSLIDAINLLKADNVKYFAFYRNNIWIAYRSESKKQSNFVVPFCGTSEIKNLFYDDVIVVPPATKQLTVFEQIRSTILTYSLGIQKLWPTIALLFLLVTLTIIKLIRHFRLTID